MKPTLIQVFEHQKLRINEDGFSRKQYDALHKQAEEFRDFYSVYHNGVKFNHYVGVIQIGKLTIEILPKAGNDDNKGHWKTALLHMLRESGKLRLRSTDNALLSLKRNSLLSLYVLKYLEEVESILHQGLTKKYRKHEGNLFALRGKLSFNKHLSQNLVHKERFFVEYTTYDKEHFLNKVLLKALEVIKALPFAVPFLDRINRLILDFPEMETRKITESEFKRIALDRKTAHYSEAVKISGMFLFNYRPDISGGRNDVLAILFDMNSLFEQYIFKKLKRLETSENISVRAQKRATIWNSEAGNKLIKPDIILEKDGTTFVLDTKWKVLKERKPSDADLKQMFMYNHKFEVNDSLLLYPQPANMEDIWGDYTDKVHRCGLGFVNILDAEGNLNKNIGADILAKLSQP